MEIEIPDDDVSRSVSSLEFFSLRSGVKLNPRVFFFQKSHKVQRERERERDDDDELIIHQTRCIGKKRKKRKENSKPPPIEKMDDPTGYPPPLLSRKIKTSFLHFFL